MLIFAALPATAMSFVVPVSQYQQCVLLVSDPGLYPCITTTEDSYVETSSVIAQWCMVPQRMGSGFKASVLHCLCIISGTAHTTVYRM